ncbi:MAG: hypothetical protein JW682_08380 [Campylobacterales bacterium]|nr:hypothetical protein [Campylobacterales bacterium]HEO98740.1 hypothetical protein [Campylobacterota bacterium]
MKSIFKTLIISTAVLFVNGCGGGGSSSTSISDKNYILIMYDAPSDICELPAFRDTLESEGFVNPITSEESNTISCEDYGRVNDEFGTCYEDSMANYDPDLVGDVACVVGFDDFIQVMVASYKNSEAKPSLTEATDTLQTSLIQIAE